MGLYQLKGDGVKQTMLQGDGEKVESVRRMGLYQLQGDGKKQTREVVWEDLEMDLETLVIAWEVVWEDPLRAPQSLLSIWLDMGFLLRMMPRSQLSLTTMT